MQEELYQIRGNVKDPTGNTDMRGVEMGVDFTQNALAHPRFRWRDREATVDLYAAGNGLMIHFYCPQCCQTLRVTSERKDIRFEAGGQHGGRLSITEMRCTYPDCGWHVKIEDNVAKDC